MEHWNLAKLIPSNKLGMTISHTNGTLKFAKLIPVTAFVFLSRGYLRGMSHVFIVAVKVLLIKITFTQNITGITFGSIEDRT